MAGPKTSEIWDPGSNDGSYVAGKDQWELTRSGLNFPRNYGVTATLLENDGHVFVFGGNGSTTQDAGTGEISQGPLAKG